MYCCGRTCSTSRSIGIATALACSRTRATSAPRISLSLIATMPLLLMPRTLGPEIAAYTLEISQPAMFSASSTAARIADTVASMLTTFPRRIPFDGDVPMPMMSTPSSVTSPTMQAILVVPMSRPTMISVFLVLAMGCSVLRVDEGGGGQRSGVEGDGHQVGAIAEVDRAEARALGVGELGPRGVERVHARGRARTDGAELDRGGVVVGAERQRVVRVDVDLADLGAGAGGAPGRERG